jgi:hypothetical protein
VKICINLCRDTMCVVKRITSRWAILMLSASTRPVAYRSFLYIYIYIYICIYVYICIYICMYIYIHIYLHIFVYTHTWSIYAYTYIYKYIYYQPRPSRCIFMYIYIYIHIYTYICTYIFIHTYTYIYMYICSEHFYRFMSWHNVCDERKYNKMSYNNSTSLNTLIRYGKINTWKAAREARAASSYTTMRAVRSDNILAMFLCTFDVFWRWVCSSTSIIYIHIYIHIYICMYICIYIYIYIYHFLFTKNNECTSSYS